MRERLEIVPFEPSDRLYCPEILVRIDGIFFKPSNSVNFRQLERRTDCAISLIFQENHVEGHFRGSLRAPEELTRSGQRIGHCLSRKVAMCRYVGGFARGFAIVAASRNHISRAL
jgi:hypothetical protein